MPAEAPPLAGVLAAVLRSWKHQRRLGLLTATGLAGCTLIVSRQLLAKSSAGSVVLPDQPEQRSAAAREKRTPAVDARFLKRLLFLLRIVVPSWHSEEALMLGTQAALLVSRSLLSLRMARLGGVGLRAVVNRSRADFSVALADFFLSGAAAAFVNSGIKWLTNCNTVAWRLRLTRHVHSRYLARRNFYHAAVLRAGGLDCADARIVEDLHTFCREMAELFTRTFKPALDVVLNTRRLAANTGYAGILTLYAYFLASGGAVRALSPPIPRLVAQGAALEGAFRRSHARLIAHAEEVAFLGGAAREEALLNSGLEAACGFSARLHLLQFRQSVLDQWALKYLASCVGWPILALPFLARPADGADAADVAARYKECDSLMQGAAASLGDLLLVYKRLQRLAGYTARVTELLEAFESNGEQAPDSALRLGDGDALGFDAVDVHAPDGRLLVRGLTLQLRAGRNVIVTGPNGGGKTSIFRVLAGLWPPSAGTVSVPRAELGAAGGCALFYVPQRPYLVTGSLRDQVLYPFPPPPPGTPAAAACDAQVLACLRRVRLDALGEGPSGLGRAHHDWADVLSGGEKQRLGLARVFYHRPRFAVLDESTSAINPDEEGGLYEQLAACGITLFSVAHRLELRRFHQLQLEFAADGEGGWRLSELGGAEAAAAEA